MKSKSLRRIYKRFYNLSRQQQWRRLRKALNPGTCRGAMSEQMFSSPLSISEPGTHTRDPTTGPGDTAESLPASVTSRVDSCDNADPFPNSCQILYSVETAASDEEGNGLELCDARISSIATDLNNSSFRNFQNETCWTGISDLSLLDSITAWSVLEPNVPHAAVTKLLLSLNRFHSELPKTFHTLLPQPKLQYHPMGEGLYCMFICLTGFHH